MILGFLVCEDEDRRLQLEKIVEKYRGSSSIEVKAYATVGEAIQNSGFNS